MAAIFVTVECPEPKSTETLSFSDSPVRIGRNALNNVRLDLPYVSAYQGAIIFDDNVIRYVDASRYGALVNRQAVQRNVAADLGGDGGVIEIGDLRIVVARAQIRQVSDDTSSDGGTAIEAVAEVDTSPIEPTSAFLSVSRGRC